MCTAVLRYSNSTLADFIEYMLLPLVKEGLNHTTGDAHGFTELLSLAMKLSKTVNSFDESRSTQEEHLTPRFMAEWSEALLRD